MQNELSSSEKTPGTKQNKTNPWCSVVFTYVGKFKGKRKPNSNNNETPNKQKTPQPSQFNDLNLQ